MLRQHVGLLGLGLFLAACQGPEEYFRGPDLGTGQAGSGPTGAAGAIGSGAAGSGPTGTAGIGPTGVAGSIATGTAGTSAGGTGGDSGAGTAGTSAAAGTTGAAGTIGAAGRGGTTGTGGGGTTGSAGRGGTGGGAGGRGGRGGTTGTAGRGGATGTGGASGNTCPLGGRLDCTTAGALQLTPDGQVVDFSAGQWNTMTSKFCDAHGLDGGLSSYAGTGSTAMAAVDTMAGNLRLNFMVTAGQYAGGRLNFDSCVTASTFNSVQFTASLTAGSLTNCVWQIQIQTQDQRPTTATNPSGGTCSAATCERYPAASLTAPTATATTYTTRFMALDNPAGSTVATASQISGLQWQVNSGNNGSGTCTAEIHIDNIRFVTQ